MTSYAEVARLPGVTGAVASISTAEPCQTALKHSEICGGRVEVYNGRRLGCAGVVLVALAVVVLVMVGSAEAHKSVVAAIAAGEQGVPLDEGWAVGVGVGLRRLAEDGLLGK